ncbi:MAG: helix-turn-helix domain-containing protein [Clostridiales bacterium]|jgi:excisionase family DNA binding protein|nr:helix-turn-helix domain-containing protein [Clostridiales bacterium]
MGHMTAKQAAEKWGLSLRQVQQLLKDGRIDGVTKFGRDYMIPSDAQKPEDRRRKTGRKPFQ